MARFLACSFVWLAAFGMAGTVPARPLYEPDERPRLPPEFALAGTPWFGKCYADNFWITFEKNGTLTYGYGGGTFKNGTWNLQGRDLYFEMNAKYLEFRGTMQGGVIQGEAWNVKGSRWPTLFSRKEK